MSGPVVSTHTWCTTSIPARWYSRSAPSRVTSSTSRPTLAAPSSAKRRNAVRSSGRDATPAVRGDDAEVGDHPRPGVVLALETAERHPHDLAVGRDRDHGGVEVDAPGAQLHRAPGREVVADPEVVVGEGRDEGVVDRDVVHRRRHHTGEVRRPPRGGRAGREVEPQPQQVALRVETAVGEPRDGRRRRVDDARAQRRRQVGLPCRGPGGAVERAAEQELPDEPRVGARVDAPVGVQVERRGPRVEVLVELEVADDQLLVVTDGPFDDQCVVPAITPRAPQLIDRAQRPAAGRPVPRADGDPFEQRRDRRQVLVTGPSHRVAARWRSVGGVCGVRQRCARVGGFAAFHRSLVPVVHAAT